MMERFHLFVFLCCFMCRLSCFHSFKLKKCWGKVPAVGGAMSRMFGCNANSDYTAVMIVPTGIGASIGGYAGDALPAARLISKVVDRLITHPNVLNGAMMYWPMDNVMYVEGYALDEFASGKWGLRQCKKGGNTIGLLLDRGIEPDLRLRHVQVADAARATLGLNVAHCVVTSKPLGISIQVSPESGASWGSVENTATLVEGARELIQQGCNAIAIVARFPEDEEIDTTEGIISDDKDNINTSYSSAKSMFEDYRKGEGVDGIAGAEALISHVVTKRLGIPCAHAPAFAPMDVEPGVSPKACAEELGYTFLPCVLANLHRAPMIVPLHSNDSQDTRDSYSYTKSSSREVIYADDVDAVVVPYNAMGGPAVLSLLSSKRRVLVIAVEDNRTTMKVDRAAVMALGGSNISNSSKLNGAQVVVARSYAEAAGLLAAHKAGILLESLTDTVKGIPITEL